MDIQPQHGNGDFDDEGPELAQGDSEELCGRLHGLNVLDKAWRTWRAVVAHIIMAQSEIEDVYANDNLYQMMLFLDHV